MKLESKKLLFLLSSGMSLARWNELGVLSREVDIYSRLAGHFRELWWYSYGENDHRFAKRLGCIKLFSPDRPVSCNPQAVEDYNRAMIDKHPDFFNQFDFAKTNQVSAAYMGAELKKAFGARLIIRQGYWYPLKYRLHTRNPLSAASLYYLHQPRLYQMADAIILTSQAARRKLTQAYAIDESLVHCLENPVNTAVFRPYHPVNDNAVSVLFIGRLAFQKNVISLVKAISSLPVSLTIVGDGRYRKKILKLKEKYRLDLRILTHIDNFALPSLYNNHDIFVLPSRWEGNSKVLLEAMACGMPVIAADSWGIRGVVKNGENGILCGRNYRDIRGALRCLIADRRLRRKISVRARQRVRINNDLDRVIDKELAIYSSLT